MSKTLDNSVCEYKLKNLAFAVRMFYSMVRQKIFGVLFPFSYNKILRYTVEVVCLLAAKALHQKVPEALNLFLHLSPYR